MAPKTLQLSECIRYAAHVWASRGTLLMTLCSSSQQPPSIAHSFPAAELVRSCAKRTDGVRVAIAGRGVGHRTSPPRSRRERKQDEDT